MGLFNRKPDAMSVTLSIVQALMDNDEVATNQAAAAASRLSAYDIFNSVGRFYELIAAQVTPENHQVMLEELEATKGPAELVEAVVGIGKPLIVDRDGLAATNALNLYGMKLIDRPDNLWAGVQMEMLDAVARINNRLGITLNWS